MATMKTLSTKLLDCFPNCTLNELKSKVKSEEFNNILMDICSVCSTKRRPVRDKFIREATGWIEKSRNFKSVYNEMLEEKLQLGSKCNRSKSTENPSKDINGTSSTLSDVSMEVEEISAEENNINTMNLSKFREKTDNENKFLLFAKNNPEYVQYYDSALNLTLLSSTDQLVFYEKAKCPLLYFGVQCVTFKDAPKDSLKSMDYVGLVPLDNNVFSAPVFEIITPKKGRLLHLKKCLLRYKDFCLKNYHWPPVKAVIATGLSFKIIGLLAEGFNYPYTLPTYINECFKILIKLKDRSSDMVTIHISSYNFFQSIKLFIKRYIHQSNEDTFVYNILNEIFEIAIGLRELEHLKLWFISFAYLLKLPKKNKKFIQCIGNFINLSAGKVTIESNTDELNKIIFPETPRSFRENPFYQFFKNSDENWDRNFSDGSDVTNEFYCPQFFDFFLKKYIPIICLWTSIMLDDDVFKQSKKSHLLYTRTYFRILQKYIFGETSRFSMIESCKSVRIYILGSCEEVRTNLPKEIMSEENDNEIETTVDDNHFSLDFYHGMLESSSDND